MFGAHAIEHGSSRSGRWLRERRLRLTLWIAAVEGLLYVVPRPALVGGGRARRDRRRLLVVRGPLAAAPTSCGRSSWIFAASQLLVLCVPIALALVKAVAIGVIALLAIVGADLPVHRASVAALCGQWGVAKR